MPRKFILGERTITPSEFNLAIFADTDLPNDPNEIIEKTLVDSKRVETLESYIALAERTLAENGISFEDSQSLEDSRLLDDVSLSQELREAFRLLYLASSYKTLNELMLKILSEARSAGGKADGIENVPSLIRSCEATAMEIGALGQTIKARAAEPFVYRAKDLEAKRKIWGRLSSANRKSGSRKDFNRILDEAIRSAIKRNKGKGSSLIARRVVRDMNVAKKLKALDLNLNFPVREDSIRKKIEAVLKTL